MAYLQGLQLEANGLFAPVGAAQAKLKILGIGTLRLLQLHSLLLELRLHLLRLHLLRLQICQA
ncbi:MAG TPA: hypothetical protein DDY43_13705 [Synechococcales bacterium UBA10510]|nr:hypothetical protein [Synechococcales bacterium UBA10510]